MKQLSPFIVLFLMSCASTKNYNAAGGEKIVSEKTYLTVTASDQKIDASKHAAAAVMGAVLPPLIDLGTSVAKTAAKNSALRYQGQYKAFNSESGFFQTKTDVRLPLLTLTRKIKMKNGREEDAVSITLSPEVSKDLASFRYKVSNVTYYYSIAKTKSDWDYIDAAMEIKVKSLAINKGQYEVKDLRGTSIVIPMIKVGTTYAIDSNTPLYSGWIPFPPFNIIENEVLKTTKDTKLTESEKKKGGKTDPKEEITEVITMKKTVNEPQIISDNVGNYEIEITVVETNPYRIKAENKQQLIEKSGDKAADFLKALVGLTKKEEKKQESAKE